MKTSLQTEGFTALSDPRLSNQSQDAKEVLLWSREEFGVNIAVRPYLHSFLTHNKHHPFENKVRDLYFYKEVYSFVIEVVITG